MIIIGVLIFSGIAGTVGIGSRASNIAQNQGFSFPDPAASFQIGKYFFTFITIAGRIVVI